MRAEHDDQYALVASKGGAPEHPHWYHNLKAHPDKVTIHDRWLLMDAKVREVSGEERLVWWDRAVVAFPAYSEFQEKTTRKIPLLVAEPLS